MENMQTATIKKMKKVQELITGGMKISQALKKVKLSPRTYYENAKKAGGEETKKTPKKPHDPSNGPAPIKAQGVRLLLENGTEIHFKLNSQMAGELVHWLTTVSVN